MIRAPSTRIGQIVRRLRKEKKLSQQALSSRLGISASYLNLIEHDQRSITASLLIKLTPTPDVGLEELSGSEAKKAEVLLRQPDTEPEHGTDMETAAHDITAIAAQL